MESHNIDNELKEISKQKRPGFLTVLCILTFIATGLSITTAFSELMRGKYSEEEMDEVKVEFAKSIDEAQTANLPQMAEMVEKIMNMELEKMASYPKFPILKIVIGLIGLLAALLMYQGRKIGFHIYIIYCITAILSLYMVVSSINVPTIYIVFMVIFSLLFIFMYSRNLKWLK